MKKLILALTIIALIFGAVSCNGDVDEALFGNDFHYYEVQDDGSWVCSRNDCDHVLEGTEENKDYILVLNSKGQPGTVYPLETNNDLGLTVSGTTYTLNSDKALTYYLRTSSGTLLINTPNADVHRYGTIDEVAIYKVKNSSYHEFGTVKDIAILDGHLSLGPTAKVDDLAVAKGKTGTESVSFDFDENAEVKIFAIYNNQLASVTVNGTAVSAIEQKTEIAQSVVEIPGSKEARKGTVLYNTVAEALADTTQTGIKTVKIVNDIPENKNTISVGEGDTLVLSINVKLINIKGDGSGAGELNNEGTLINFGEISNRGEGTKLNVSGISAEVKNYNTITNESGATVSVSGGAKVKNNGTVEVAEGASFEIEAGATLEVGSGATLDNKGTLTNNGTVSNSGTVKGEIEGTGAIEASEDASFETDPDYVAQIFNGETAGKKYTTLEAAVNAAERGQTVKMLDNSTLESTLYLNKSITFDLQGKIVDGFLNITEGSEEDLTVIITDSSQEKGKWTYNPTTKYSYTIAMETEGSLIIDNVIIENGSETSYGVIYAEKYPLIEVKGNAEILGCGYIGIFIPQATLKLYDCKVVGTFNSAIQTHGTVKDSSIYIYDGAEIDCGENRGIYLANGNLYVSGGTISGASAVDVKGGGTVNITGGKFVATGAKQSYVYKDSNSIFTGDAFVIEACDFGGLGNSTVSISGGEFISTHADGVAYYTHNNNKITNEKFITGGVFSSDPSAYVAPGYCAVAKAGMWSIDSLFAGGDGTKDNPWLITDYETMQNISKCVTYDIGPRISQNGSKIVNSEFHYWKVKDGIKEIDCQELNGTWIPVNLYGSFDGNGVTFKNLDNFLFFNVGDPAITEEITIENFKVICDISFNESYKAAAAVARNVCHNLTLKDINIQGRIMGTFGTASFFAYGPGNFTSISGADAYNVEEYKSNIANWKFINCISSADLYDFQGGTSGFFVNAIIPGTTINSYGNGKDTLLIEDSGWFGTGTHSPSYTGYGSADSTAYIQDQDSDAFMAHTTFKYSQDFVDTYGVALQASGLPNYSVGTFEYNGSGESDKHIYKFRVNDKTRVAILDIQTISAEENSELVISKAENAVEVFVSLCLQSGKNAMVNVITTREHTWSTDNSWNSGITNYKYTGEVGDIFKDLLLEKTEPEDLTSTWVQVVQLDENGLPVYVGRTAAIKYK